MVKRHFKGNKGFTLIELMIVIAIIGILAAIAIPNFNRARRNAQSKACIANIRTIESAVEMFNMEQIDSFMSADGDDLCLDTLKSYFSGNKIPSCPAQAMGGAYSFDGDGTIVRCAVHGTVDSPVGIDSLT